MEEHTLSQRALAETLGTALLVLVGPGLRRRHACPGRRQGARDRRVRPTRHLVRVRLRDHRARVCDRQGLGLPHQPGGDVRARGDQALPLARGASLLGRAARGRHRSARSGSGRCSPRPASTWASARRPSTRTPTPGAPRSSPSSSAPRILMFAILGIVDARSPGDFAGIVIGGVVVAIIMVLGPITAASLNPARAIGPAVAATIAGGTTHWNQIIPVYILPGLAGAALAAFCVRLPRHSEEGQAADRERSHPSRPRRSPRGEVERTRNGYCRDTDEEAPERSGERGEGVARRAGRRARRPGPLRRRGPDPRPRAHRRRQGRR